MPEANHQDLAMEQDPEDVMLMEDKENKMDNEIQEHVDDDLQTGDGVQAEVAELDKDADVDEGHLGEWMQDGKSFEGQAGDPVQIPDLEKVETVPEVGTKCT